MIPTDTQLREFLLRRMPAADAARLEQAILMEDEVAERLRAEEFDLIDDYAAGGLAPEDRADVERHLLTSVDNIHSLRIARLLSRESSLREAAPSAKQVEALGPRRRTGRFAAAGALLAAGLAAVVLIPHWEGTPRRPVGIAPPPVVLSAPAADSSHSPTEAGNSLPILTLLADVNRGSAQPRLHWRASLASVRLQAEVPHPERGTLYSIRVYDPAGRRLFEGAPRPVQAAGPYYFVDTVVPSAALGPGERIVSLLASNAAAAAPAKYTWHIVGLLD
jgi:hypothetical protein